MSIAFFRKKGVADNIFPPSRESMSTAFVRLGTPFLLAFSNHVIFLLIDLLRLNLLAPLFQHKGQHAVVFLVKPGISLHISAYALLTDMESLYHFSVQQPVSQKCILGKIFFPLLFDLLPDGLG